MARTKKVEVNELDKLAKSLKVEYQKDYNKPEKVRSIRMPFKKSVWAELANKEGELLAACCANISTIRDELISAMRDDGWMDSDDIRTVVINMSGHDWKPDHPVSFIAKVYETFEPHMVFKDYISDVDLDNLDDVKNQVLFGEIFKFCSTAKGFYSDFDEKLYNRADVNRALYEVIPCVRTLAKRIEEAGFPPVEGYAIVRKATNRVYGALQGMAIWPTKEETEKVLGMWIRGESIKPEDAEVRAVRVSWEKGVELLHEVETPFTFNHPKAMISSSDYDKLFRGLNDLRREVKSDLVDAILHEAIGKIQEIPHRENENKSVDWSEID